MLFTGKEVFNGEKLCWRSRVQRKASGLRWYSGPRAQFFSYGLIYICKPVNYLFIFSTGFSFSAVQQMVESKDWTQLAVLYCGL